MNALYERYRPRDWSQVVGQDKIIRQLDCIRRHGEGNTLAGHAYWLSGQSGTGKTTIAKLIAQEIAEHFNVEEIDAGDATVSELARIEHDAQFPGMGDRNGKAYIINEAHGLRKDAIRKLLVVLERIPRHVAWIFTTTNDGEQSLFDDCDDASPLLSRCLNLSLNRRGLAEVFAARAREIAVAEDLDGQPIERYVRLAKDKRNNLRAMLAEIEAGGMLE